MKEEFLNTDHQANRFAAKVMLLTILFLILIYILTILRVFATPVWAMSIAVVIGTVCLSIPPFIVLVRKEEGEWVKYLMVTAATIMVSTLGLLLSHNVVLLYLYPIAIASLYFSEKLSRYTIILSITLTSMSQIFSPYAGGIIDRNTYGLTQSLYGVVVYGVVPRCMQLLMISYIFQELAKNTRKMLDRIFAAEQQKDIKMAQSQLYIDEIIQTLNSMAEGNMQVQLKEDYSGEFAPIKSAFEHISLSLSNTLLHIDHVAEQVNSSAVQVASGAQALAEGATGQAASVEELNASIERIAEQTVESLVIVETASKSFQRVDESIDAGNVHMEQLSEAMENIGTSSNHIVKITKVIEDIASQTNILALNAAIEAARAGDAGKGFVIVADEVRNLAAKSTETVKQVAALIQTSVDSVSQGIEITTQTVQNLKAIKTSTYEVKRDFVKIEQTSAEQVSAIEQIKQGLSQVSAIVQENTATAEENSASSEEMSTQAAVLREEVGKFQLSSELRKNNGIMYA